MPIPTSLSSLTSNASYLGKYGEDVLSSSSISNTVLVPDAPAGVYRIGGVMVCEVPGSGGGQCTVNFTDTVGNKSITVPSFTVMNAGEWQTGDAILLVDHGDISYSVSFSPSGVYRLILTVERLR